MLRDTLTTSRSALTDDDGDDDVADELIVVLECDAPLAGSTRHRLRDVDEVVIGRGHRRTAERVGRRLSLCFADGCISMVHASITRQQGSYVLVDRGSKNGVLVDGRRVVYHVLDDGDLIECGRTFLQFGKRRRRSSHEPLDAGADALATTALGVPTFHEPLAAQLRQLCAVAPTSISVLILGATGTGKEVVARGIHALSGRRGPCVAVNTGALPESLVEAELFGARKGAFTGAVDDRAGLVRASDQGTLFLDEIGDLPRRAQPALLRVLQEREVLPIGATRTVTVDIRVVAATHRDLEQLERAEQFRADLLARLAGFVVRLPTLNDRREDFGLLLTQLLRRLAPNGVRVAPEAMRALWAHSWPLNVRELENALRAALSLASTRLELAHLPQLVRQARDKPHGAPAPRNKLLTAEQRALCERLRELLSQYQGNISAVARHLGKERVQIRRWIKAFDIQVDHRVS